MQQIQNGMPIGRCLTNPFQVAQPKLFLHGALTTYTLHSLLRSPNHEASLGSQGITCLVCLDNYFILVLRCLLVALVKTINRNAYFFIMMAFLSLKSKKLLKV